MNREAVIEIASTQQGDLLVRLRNAPVAYPDMDDFSTMDFGGELPALTTLQDVQQYGGRLRTALSQHQAVGSELLQIFGTMPPNIASVDIVVGGRRVDDFRWETLCDSPPSFLAVRDHCSVKRVVSSPARDVRVFNGPVTMSAYLSPFGVASRNEFQVIAAAVNAARQGGLDIQLTAYLGEQELLDDLSAQVAVGQLDGVKVRPIPEDAIGIEKSLQEDAPQLLHFFCHGVSAAGVQLLEFASINDHDTAAFGGRSAGSIKFSLERLILTLRSAGSVWMTVLNSCSGAASVPRLHSMARAIADGFSPLAIGLAEPIKEVDATVFASGFYGKALETIAASVSPLQPGASVGIDLGLAVARARSLLHNAATQENERFGRWALPILYQREGGLRVHRIAEAPAALKKRIETVAAMLRGMPSDTPLDLRQQVLELLDKTPAVPASLRPDVYGNLA